MHHVRGNHDAMRDPTMARQDAPYAIELDGVTLAVLDTVVPGRVGGALDAGAARLARRPRPRRRRIRCSCSGTIPRSTTTTNYGLSADDHEALLACSPAARTSSATSPATRTRNHVVRDPRGRDVPFVEVACAKDYPGAWAEYRIYEGGYTQVMRRVAAPDGPRLVGAAPAT